MRSDFWKTTRQLWRFRRTLSLALIGAIISAVCFSGGLVMLIPIFNIFFHSGDQGGEHPLRKIIHQYLLAPDSPTWRVDLVHRLSDAVPDSIFASFLLVLAAVLVLTLIGSAGRYLHELLTITAVQRAAVIWRARLFERQLFAPLGAFGQDDGSGYASRVLVDVNVLTRGQLAILSKAVQEVFKGAGALVVALFISWQLTLLALIAAPLIALSMRVFGKQIKRASKRALKEQTVMLRALNNAYLALPIIKTSNAEGYERRRFSRVNRKLFNQQMAMRQARALAGPVIETIAMLGVMGTALIAAWWYFSKNSTGAIDILAVMTVLVVAGASLKPLTQIMVQIKESDAAAKRILQAINLPQEPVQFLARRDQPKLARHQRDVKFDHVHFAYPMSESDVLCDINLTIPFGQTTAIVGTNGSGKTSLMNLLPRLYQPRSGRVLIDDIDIAKVNLRSLREQISVVSQQTILFEGTIAQNIAYARPLTPMSRIEEAAHMAGAHEFITQLPAGYDTPLGEAGEGLSGGQRQRLAIARAVLCDPAILILDEATSQIDADSEARISQALRTLRRGRTTFIIAHRLSTVIDADQILVMADGRIVDRGKHGELLNRCPVYQLLTRSQLQPSAD